MVYLQSLKLNTDIDINSLTSLVEELEPRLKYCYYILELDQLFTELYKERYKKEAVDKVLDSIHKLENVFKLHEENVKSQWSDNFFLYKLEPVEYHVQLIAYKVLAVKENTASFDCIELMDNVVKFEADSYAMIKMLKPALKNRDIVHTLHLCFSRCFSAFASMENANPRNLEKAKKYFDKVGKLFNSTVESDFADIQKWTAECLADAYRRFYYSLKSPAEQIKHLEITLNFLNEYSLDNFDVIRLLLQKINKVAEEETALDYYRKAVSLLEKETSIECLYFLSFSYKRIGIITQNIDTINKALLGYTKVFNFFRETNKIDKMRKIEEEQNFCSREIELIQGVLDNEVSKIYSEVITQFEKISDKNCTTANIKISTSAIKKEFLVHFCTRVLKMESCDVEYDNESRILKLNVLNYSLVARKKLVTLNISKKPE